MMELSSAVLRVPYRGHVLSLFPCILTVAASILLTTPAHAQWGLSGTATTVDDTDWVQASSGGATANPFRSVDSAGVIVLNDTASGSSGSAFQSATSYWKVVARQRFIFSGAGTPSNLKFIGLGQIKGKVVCGTNYSSAGSYANVSVAAGGSPWSDVPGLGNSVGVIGNGTDGYETPSSTSPEYVLPTALTTSASVDYIVWSKAIGSMNFWNGFHFSSEAYAAFNVIVAH